MDYFLVIKRMFIFAIVITSIVIAMNIGKLIQNYFSNDVQQPVIEVFDDANIVNVCHSIIETLKNISEIEICVLEALNFCYYEILDNVLVHSGKTCGVTITRYDKNKSLIQVLVADDGIGVHKSLTNNTKYENISEEQALKICLEDKVTDGQGMGFGLYPTMRLIQKGGLCLEIRSGNRVLKFSNDEINVEKCDFWQGTIIYLELKSDEEYDSNNVIGADCQDNFEYNYLDENLENLW